MKVEDGGIIIDMAHKLLYNLDASYFGFTETTHRPMRIQTQIRAGFTLMEVAVAAAVAGLLFAGLFKGYTLIGRRVQYAAYSLAAHTQAMQQLEQTLAAQWSPSSGIATLLNTYPASRSNYLYLPSAQGVFVPCTNYVSISQVSTNPPYVMVRVDCVWAFSDMGTFSNTVAILRAP
jgi:prepilin-type N-terminal cleavage/methylation domain-containing protein